MSDSQIQRTTTLRTGFWLLAVSLPFGVTLEALHAFKSRTYLGSQMRRELWRMAHAHGTLLGILCLVYTALAERHVAEASRRSIARLISMGAILMPLGFFLGGILNSEGDPSPGVLLVPVGAALLLVALVRCALQATGRGTNPGATGAPDGKLGPGIGGPERGQSPEGGVKMKWERPDFVEIGMNAEIGGYQSDFADGEPAGPRGPVVEASPAQATNPALPAF